VNLDLASKPMIHFLRYLYHTDQRAISGDIDSLFQLNIERN